MVLTMVYNTQNYWVLGKVQKSSSSVDYPYRFSSSKSVIFEMTKCTDIEFAVMALILDEEEEEQRDVKKRKWVHEEWVNRERDGEFGILYKELMMRQNFLNILECLKIVLTYC
jgi:hypothetical protein